MKSAILVSLVVACVAVASSSAFAFEKWECTAGDSRGAKFTAMVDGLFDTFTKDAASRDALAKCAAGSRAPKTCKIVACVRPD